MNVVLLLSSNLMTCSQVAGAAARAGVTLFTAASPAEIAERRTAAAPCALLIDLTLPGLDLRALVAAHGSPAGGSLEILAFGPHVHEQRLESARQAGCSQVFSRGQFFAQSEQILRRLAGPRPQAGC